MDGCTDASTDRHFIPVAAEEILKCYANQAGVEAPGAEGRALNAQVVPCCRREDRGTEGG